MPFCHYHSAASVLLMNFAWFGMLLQDGPEQIQAVVVLTHTQYNGLSCGVDIMLRFL